MEASSFQSQGRKGEDTKLTPGPLFMIPLSRSRKVPNEELANESRSTHITVAADMVFSLSHYLSGVSWLG